MAVQKLSENVKIDVDEKKIFVNMSAMTDEDKTLVEWNKGDGFIVVPMRTRTVAKSKQKQSRNKAWYLKQLAGDAEGLAEFNRICSGKGKGCGFLSAVSWFNHRND